MYKYRMPATIKNSFRLLSRVETKRLSIMKHLLILLSAIILSLPATYAKKHKVKVKTKKETRDVGTFSSISVSSGIDVYLTQGDKTSVVVVANKDYMDNIVTEVENDKLVIRINRSITLRNRSISVYVTTPDINQISASGGADVYGETTLKSERIKLSGSGGADFRLTVDAKELVCNVSGGSDIYVTGNAYDASFHASGGADINAYDLKTKNANVNTSGGSDARVYVTETASFHASGGSDIYYKGNPKKKSVSKSKSCDIVKR
jgi:hypothetical protein